MKQFHNGAYVDAELLDGTTSLKLAQKLPDSHMASFLQKQLDFIEAIRAEPADLNTIVGFSHKLFQEDAGQRDPYMNLKA